VDKGILIRERIKISRLKYSLSNVIAGHLPGCFFLTILIPKPIKNIRLSTIAEPRMPDIDVPASAEGRVFLSLPGP